MMAFCGEEYKDMVNKKPVIIVPQTSKQKVIADTHVDIMTGHESTSKTKKRIISPYWWLGLDTEINIYIKSCDKCQKNRMCT